MAKDLKQWGNSHPIDKASTVLPGVQSDARWARHIVTDMSPALHDWCQTDHAKQEGVSSFSKIHSMTGYTMDPWGLPATSPELLQYTWSNKFAHNLELVIRTLYPPDFVRLDTCMHGASVRRAANMGAPQFTTDLSEKIKVAEYFLDHFDDVANLFHRRDYTTLYQKYGLLFMALVRRRFMPDSVDLTFDSFGRIINAVPKERDAYDYFGKKCVADKTCKLHPFVFDMRVRLIMAISFLVNLPLRPYNDALNNAEALFAGLTAHAGDVSDTLKTINPVVKDMIPLGTDVSHLDQVINPALINLIVDTLQEVHGLSEDFTRWLRYAYFCPWMANGIYHDQAESLPYCKGSPLQDPMVGYLLRTNGLYSGMNLTTNTGRIVVLTASLTSLQDIGIVADNDQAASDFLTWRSKYHLMPQKGTRHNVLHYMQAYNMDVTTEKGMKTTAKSSAHSHNQSDDMLFWLQASSVSTFMQDFPAAMKKAYSGLEVKVLPKEESSYLSRKVLKRPGDRNYHDEPSIEGGIVKTLVPESSRPKIYMMGDAVRNEERVLRYMGIIGTAAKEFVNGPKAQMFGLFTRNEQWDKESPYFSEVWGIVVDSLNRLDPNIFKAMKDFARLETYWIEHIKVTAISATDVEVILDPAKLEYRYTEADVTDSIYKQFYYKIPAEKLQKVKQFIFE